MASLLSQAQNNWELAKKKNGIEVYTKEAPGWPLKAYLARGIINKPFEEIVAYLHQFDQRVNWAPDCLVSDILHKQGSKEYIVYFEIDAPWPTSNRDMVVKMLVDTTADNTTVNFRYTGLANYIPEKDDKIRINKAIGRWTVRKIDDTKCEVSTEGKATTGGDVPEWLANMFVEENPYQSILRLRSMLETGKI